MRAGRYCYATLALLAATYFSSGIYWCWGQGDRIRSFWGLLVLLARHIVTSLLLFFCPVEVKLIDNE